MRRLRSVLLAAGGAMLLLTGCSTPGRRAEQRPAAFAKLSASDQKLVLHGRVRTGMSKDAVYIAWGAPNRRVENGKAKEAIDHWIYERQISVYAPMGLSSQAYPPLGLDGPSFSLGLRPGFGYGGVSDTGFLYSPRVMITEVQVKRAQFVDDRLRVFAVGRGAR